MSALPPKGGHWKIMGESLLMTQSGHLEQSIAHKKSGPDRPARNMSEQRHLRGHPRPPTLRSGLSR